MDGKSKKITKKVLLYVLLIILALIWIVPIFTLVATALKHKKDFMSGLSLFQLKLRGTTLQMLSQKEIFLTI